MGKFKEQEILDMFNDPEFDKKRKEATLELLKILSELVAKHPEQRFGQLLQNYGFVEFQHVTINGGRGHEYEENIWLNEFYLEPVALLKRVQAKLK